MLQSNKLTSAITSFRTSTTTSKMTKKLAVFDFDHTVCDDNSDIVVRKLLRHEQIPENVKTLYRSNGWTAYMQAIFKLLYKYNINEYSIKNAIIKIPAVDSIPKLITTMHDKLNFDVIIISDSNSVFINEWIEANNLSKYIHSVYTNPAKYNEKGLLKIEMYHIQKECKLSTKNLCKGKILDEFIKNQAALDINYSQTVYVGDGKNDFCPILRLKTDDLACVRDGYPCVDLVTESLESKSEYKVKCNVCIWKTGKDILKELDK